MKVKAIKTIDTPTHSLIEGEVYDIRAEDAKKYESKGYVTTKKVEAKPLPTGDLI